MDQQPTYEQLIARKLVDRPVPDMADAIWRRIEAQLDIDMPTDDLGDPPPPGPSGSGTIGWGAGIVLLALLSVLFIYKNKQQTPSSETKSGSPIEQTSKPLEPTIGPPGSTSRGDRTVPLNNSHTLSGQQSGLDSLLPHSLPNNLPLAVDTSKDALPEPLVQAPTITDTPVIKKKRGVSGLKESDYRIVPKKDSTP